MRTDFGIVLARERVRLGRVTNSVELATWRRRVVEEVMLPHSPYALVLRPSGDEPGRATFLAQWRELIAEALDRVRRSTAGHDANHAPTAPVGSPSYGPVPSSARPDTPASTEKTAVLVLAALHGGSTLSQIARDPWPLTAALDLALGQLVPSDGADHDHDRTG